MSNKTMRRVTGRDKLRFVLGWSEAEARAAELAYDAATMDDTVDFEEAEARSGMDRAAVESFVADPAVLAAHRVNPNLVWRAQLEQLELLAPELVETVIQGRPYYTMFELEAATGLPQIILDDLFEIRPLQFLDKTSGREIALEVVPGEYLVPPPRQFEEDPTGEAGFEEIRPATPELAYRLVAPSSFDAVKAPQELKAAFGGDVHPVLRDAQGHRRFLIPGSLDLWFRTEIAESRRLEIIKELELKLLHAVPKVGYYRVQLSSPPEDLDVTRAVFATISAAGQYDEVVFGEPDEVGFEDFGPDVSVDVSDLDFEEAVRDWNYFAIELSAAHNITKGSPDVTVFVIDSGCKTDHPELQPALRGDWQTLDLSFDVGDLDSITTPHETTKQLSHGTKVAGVVRQVAPDCCILPIKISGKATAPAYGLRAAAIRAALTYLQHGKCGVINLSWGTSGEHIGIREALKAARDREVPIATSAGNYIPGSTQTPDELHYPSAHAWVEPRINAVCAVAGVGVGDRKSTLSYYGENSITVAAPGGDSGGLGTGIYTTSTPDSHVYTSGTSFAAPHVAGLLALLLSQGRDLTAQQAIQIIEDAADPVPQANPTTPLGARADSGSKIVSLRINARRALEAVGNHGLPPSEEGEVGSTGAPPEEESGLVNINEATAEELTTLPLIGPWLAEQIVAYRETHGPFASIWELALTGMSPWAIGQLEPLTMV